MTLWQKIKNALQPPIDQTAVRRRIAWLMRLLEASTNDAEFEREFRRSYAHLTPLEQENQWRNASGRLLHYRRANEFDLMPRTLAERWLRDLKRQIGEDTGTVIPKAEDSPEVWPPAPRVPPKKENPSG